MTYTVTELVTDAYYNSGVVSRGYETPSGSQISDGVRLLNEALAEQDVKQSLIPYSNNYEFYVQTGVEEYFIPNLVDIDTVTFTLDSVRYSMKKQKANEYLGSPRTNDINSLPFTWYFEREFGGGRLYIYFNPDQNYPFQVNGVFRLNHVEETDDLDLNTTVANLGVPTVAGTGTLATGQLKVNNVDLAGSYATIGALVNYINTGVLPNIKASIEINDFVLTSSGNSPINITVESVGSDPNINEKGAVVAGSVAALTATYANGTLGAGATLTNAAALAAFSLDGVSPSLNDSVLIKDQADATQNGVYTVTTVGDGATAWVLTRLAAYDTSDDMFQGDLWSVTSGTVNAGTYWTQDNYITAVGTDDIDFTAYNNISFGDFSTRGVAQKIVKTPRGIETFYQTYLKYKLADLICTDFNFDTPPNVLKKLKEYELVISKKSNPMDLTMEKLSTLSGRGTGVNYGQVNLGRGWTTSD